MRVDCRQRLAIGVQASDSAIGYLVAPSGSLPNHTDDGDAFGIVLEQGLLPRIHTEEHLVLGRLSVRASLLLTRVIVPGHQRHPEGKLGIRAAHRENQESDDDGERARGEHALRYAGSVSHLSLSRDSKRSRALDTRQAPAPAVRRESLPDCQVT